jgi:hypothetical protein
MSLEMTRRTAATIARGDPEMCERRARHLEWVLAEWARQFSWPALFDSVRDEIERLRKVKQCENSS